MAAMDVDAEERYDAMLEFLGHFPTLSGPPPSDMKDLSDGVVMFEVLSEISPDHFDTSTIAHDSNNNWALKSNNLRKLLRNLETYYSDILRKNLSTSHDGQLLSESISSIARQLDDESTDWKDATASFVELIIAAAVMCEDRGTYVGWIMNMGEENQVMMKGIIEASLARTGEYQDLDGGDEDDGENNSEGGDDGDYDDDEYSGVEKNPSFHNIGEVGDFLSDAEDDFEGGAEMTGLFRNAMQNIDAVTHGLDVSTTTTSPSSKGGSMTISSGTTNATSQNTIASNRRLVKERDELKNSLAEVKRELATHKSQTVLMAEDTESSQKKLRALAQDLQERLQQRENELSEVEEELTKAKRALTDAEERTMDLEEKNATLADELDVATAKAAQLRKSEATVTAYRKKLEGVGVMNQQMNELEDQAAGYLRQVMDLEMETKKVPELQKKLEKVKRDLVKAEKEKVEAETRMKGKSAEVATLKADLSASVIAKKMYEDELHELRSAVQNPDANAVDAMGSGMGDSLTSAKSMKDVKEKMMRLEIENKSLKETLEATGESGAVSGAGGDSGALQTEIARLQEELKKKEAETKKLATDKDKLEAYTKKTLSKFQEKYLVALQECKTKLKEKHDKIEQLEKRSAAEKSSQKREERLLSSTIFELGLSIMQQRLKER